MSRPNRRCHGVVAFAFTAALLPAQQPAPLAESARQLWTADEAMVFQVMSQVAAAPGKDLAALLQHRQGTLPFGPAYAAVLHPIDGDRFADPGMPAKDQGFVLYAWPTEGAGRTFCLASAGALLIAELGATAPTADAATGAGSGGRPADLLQSPGKGRNGALWTIAAMVPQQRLRVQLRDDDGKPVPNGRVSLVPRTWVLQDRQVWLPQGDEGLREFDLALPAGQWTLDAAGAGEVRGVAARGLIACVAEAEGARAVALPEQLVQVEPGGLVLTLPRRMLRTARLNANEAAAIATLKNISSAQAQCQACAVIDANNNGAGEYGFFAELGGGQPVRKDEVGGVGTVKISPPVLSHAFTRVEAGQVVRSGYVFQIWLPGKKVQAVAEAGSGGAAGCEIDAAKAEVMWCAYAWPCDAGTSGNRAFFVNQAGDVLMCHNKGGAYSGSGKAPLPTAAFEQKGSGDLGGRIAANAVGHDGQHWLVVN